MGLLSRKSTSSTSSTQNTADVDITTSDQRQAAEGAIIGGNTTLSAGDFENNTINIAQTDYGAVGAAGELASDSLDAIRAVNTNSLQLGAFAVQKLSDATDTVADTVKDTANTAIEANAELTNKTLARESLVTTGVLSLLTDRLNTAVDTIKQTSSGTLDGIVSAINGTGQADIVGSTAGNRTAQVGIVAAGVVSVVVGLGYLFSRRKRKK